MFGGRLGEGGRWGEGKKGRCVGWFLSVLFKWLVMGYY